VRKQRKEEEEESILSLYSSSSLRSPCTLLSSTEETMEGIDTELIERKGRLFYYVNESRNIMQVERKRRRESRKVFIRRIGHPYFLRRKNNVTIVCCY
jgi:hypothetical protein